MQDSKAMAKKDVPLVFFDLETTGLDVTTCEIIQIGAVCGVKTFNRYMLPQRDIGEKSSAVNHLTVVDQALRYNGEPVETVPLREALTDFIDFLRSFNQTRLVAHNGRCFDFPILVRVLQEFTLLDQFQRVVADFLDTKELSKTLLPEAQSYSQENLVMLTLGKTYEAHNALNDIRALQELYQALNPDADTVARHAFNL
ncbi:hypothetical protein AGOR_G00065260 [Albula goreensis]|uniref:exodeoxyribonuclease III n=1 Tax=Albula goreensis TaxID=1534307 RepID=A0A8T3DQR1_9TELE|nr:hypothetical protein AGOR_G00065260 [Albula goreensis]